MYTTSYPVDYVPWTLHGEWNVTRKAAVVTVFTPDCFPTLALDAFGSSTESRLRDY